MSRSRGQAAVDESPGLDPGTPQASGPARGDAGAKLLRTDPPTKDSYNTQHDFVVTVVGSETATHVHAGDRYSRWTGSGPGRNIFLPLAWESGEPLLRWQASWEIDVATGRWSDAGLSP